MSDTAEVGLDSVSGMTQEGRVVDDPLDDASRTGRFRSALTAYATSDRSRELALMADLDIACRAVGLHAPDEISKTDFLVDLLDNPWIRPRIPKAPGLQVIRLLGAPEPGTMTFTDGTTTVDFYDLGRHDVRYQPAPRSAVRQALHKGLDRAARVVESRTVPPTEAVTTVW